MSILLSDSEKFCLLKYTLFLLEMHGVFVVVFAFTYIYTGYIALIEILKRASICIWVTSAKLVITGPTEGTKIKS